MNDEQHIATPAATDDSPQNLNNELEERVRHGIRELSAANTSVQLEARGRHAAEQNIKALFQRLLSAHEEERRRVAREVHDQLGQHMTLLRMQLEELGARAGGTPLGDMVVRIQTLAAQLDESIDFVTLQLRPAALDHFGLPAALRSLLSGWSKRFDISAELDTSGVDGMRLGPEAEANLYRIAQEGLHNVFKHAGARHVSVFLGTRRESVVLMIEDDGRGFDPTTIEARQTGGFGVVGMRERATLLGGHLEIESFPGHGTTLIVRVPVLDHIYQAPDVS